MAKHRCLSRTTPFDQPLSILVDEPLNGNQAIIEEAFVISPHLRLQDNDDGTTTNVVNKTLTTTDVQKVQNMSLAASSSSSVSASAATQPSPLVQKSTSVSSTASGRLKPYVSFDLFYKELESARNSELISEAVYQSLVQPAD